ncbi:MAG: transcription elongation factor GreB [Betaproteobacteria bacterium]|nr:transcription elongation factor GreB [Betaproteobacteria bacterium]MDH5222829.1 transcription elongation factor GreB [Betaproteobacteria bacterium]MDH5351851.1 transcription elongation factor GreB [Betaproteobacteria bacterium]
MSKAFLREDESEDTAPPPAAEPSAPPRNYITPAGFARLAAERKQLVEVERPQVVRTVAWAAANGDRSENADYQYGKKRLREIDRRVRFLIRRLENAEVVHSAGRDEERVFFGATVRVRAQDGGERQVSIVGADEVDAARGRVSWLSPIARALLKARAGDTVTLRTPAGEEALEILDVSYPGID